MPGVGADHDQLLPCGHERLTAHLVTINLPGCRCDPDDQIELTAIAGDSGGIGEITVNQRETSDRSIRHDPSLMTTKHLLRELGTAHNVTREEKKRRWISGGRLATFGVVLWRVTPRHRFW